MNRTIKTIGNGVNFRSRGRIKWELTYTNETILIVQNANPPSQSVMEEVANKFLK